MTLMNFLHSYVFINLPLLVNFLHRCLCSNIVFVLNDLVNILKLAVKVACSRYRTDSRFLGKCEQLF